jgi:hypothetical protein
MSTRPISEKAAEILFNRYMLQSLPLRSVQLFAPSSIEEFKTGYDAKVVGMSSFREIYLQFKSPYYSEARHRFTISLTPHQHRLLQAFPLESAYYVSPMFRTLAELNAVQSAVTTSVDFLKYYLCIDAVAIPGNVDFIQYICPASHRESPQAQYKTADDGQVRTAQHQVAARAWSRGSTLLNRFRDGRAGAHRELVAQHRCEMPENLRVMGRTDLESALQCVSGSELGLFVRIQTD